MLVRSGLVCLEQGRGSFVAGRRIDYAVQPRTRFNDWIRRQDEEPAGVIVGFGISPYPSTRVQVMFEP